MKKFYFRSLNWNFKLFPHKFKFKINKTHQINHWQGFGSLAIAAFVGSLLLECLAFSTFTVGLMAVAKPALAEGTSAHFNPQLWLLHALEWIENLGPLGAIAFILLYGIATLCLLPGSILTLGAGVVFGVVWGSIYVFLGATLGAAGAFLVGRYVARGWVTEKIADNRKFKAIDEAVGKEGLKIVILTRLSPIFPFNLLNYSYGITGVSFKDYVLGSLGMIPGTLMYVYIGSLAGSLATLGTPSSSANPTLQWAIRLIGFIATVAVTVYVTKIAQKALHQTLAEPQ